MARSPKPTRLRSEVDYDAEGKQVGYLRMPWSSNISAYGWIGLPIAVISNGRGPTLLLMLTVFALVFPSAALVGYVPRYRYPTDPLLAVLAAGGVVAAIALARLARGRFGRRGEAEPGRVRSA